MRFDAIVVGGGPAGASFAREFSKLGGKVLIVEKEKLPRFKLCGGCLSARTSGLLPEGWEREVLNEIRGGVLGFRGMEFVQRTAQRAVAYIIDRASFDHFLIKSTLEEGAELWEGTQFLGFESEGSIRVKTDRGTVEADFLVGADGFYTRVGKQLGFKKRNFFRSVEFWTEGDLEDRVVIDVGVVSRGYAWIFPKGSTLSVGVVTAGGENLREVLEVYVKVHPYLKNREVKGVRGWMIPFSSSEGDLHLGAGRVLLVGDAANIVDPLLGEGIYYAILSGKLAATSVVEAPHDPVRLYGERVKGALLDELVYAGRIARLAYTFQRVAYRMGGGYSLERFFRLLCGDLGYKDLYKKGLGEFVKSLLHFENFSHIIIDKILRRR